MFCFCTACANVEGLLSVTLLRASSCSKNFQGEYCSLSFWNSSLVSPSFDLSRMRSSPATRGFMSKAGGSVLVGFPPARGR